jgi:hypothetical protein
VPGDGGWTAGQTGGRTTRVVFQAALACARCGEGASYVGKGRGDLGRRAGGSKTEGPAQARGGERRRGGRALGEILLGLPLFEIVFLQIFE